MAPSSPYDDLLARYRATRRDPGAGFRTSRQVRDLTVIDLVGDLLLVVAVDSDGAIGPKPGDVVKTTGYACGRFGARVPLMEILASGAVPIAAFDPLAVERVPLGDEIIRGIQDELRSIGLPPEFPLSGSTEDNVPTRQTGMGVVLIGLVEKKEFRPGCSMRNDQVFCIGIPKSGPADEVRLEDPDIASAKTVVEVSTLEGVHDILPVGSKGLLFEARELADTAGLRFVADELCSLDVHKSGGPSTCFIVSGLPSIGDGLQQQTEVPVHRIGVLE
jgi:hypothetical protein